MKRRSASLVNVHTPTFQPGLLLIPRVKNNNYYANELQIHVALVHNGIIITMIMIIIFIIIFIMS